MSIRGRRDSEPPAGEAHESQAGEQQSQAGEQQSQAGEQQSQAGEQQSQAGAHDAQEPAPAFWRAQGETPESLGRDPADAPPPDFGNVPDGPPPAGVPTTTTMGPTPAYGQQASGEAPAPAARGTEATEVPEPTVAVAREPVVTEAQSGAHGSGIAAGRWSEILVAFVDDPRGSVKMAADAVDEAVNEFVNSVRARQQALESSLQGTGADTEQLRTALRECRTLWHQVRQLDLGEKTGGAAGTSG